MLTWEYPPHITGGLAVAVAGLAKALSERGHRLVVLVPRLYGDEAVVPNIELVDVSRIFSKLSAEERAELKLGISHTRSERSTMAGIYSSASYGQDMTERATSQVVTEREEKAGESIRLPGGYGPSIHHDIHLFAKFAEMYARHGKFDVVHAHDWVTFPAAEAAAKALRVPLVCHVHATEFDRSGETINQAVYDLERRGLHAADLVVTVSKYTADMVTSRYGVPASKIRVVHNSIEAAGTRSHEEALGKYGGQRRGRFPESGRRLLADYAGAIKARHVTRTRRVSARSMMSSFFQKLQRVFRWGP